MLSIKAALIGQNEEARTYTFRASTSSVDRQNEVIDQGGWQLESYKANPVILDSHRYGSIDDILGKASRVEVGPDGLEVDVQFAPTEKGQMAQRLVDDGMLRTVSVGFRSLARRPGSGAAPMMHTAMELLEVSMVAIPANRDAVRLRSVEEDQVTDETKGRRKSAADKLRGIVALLGAIIDEMEPSAPDGPDVYQDGMKPDEDMHKPGQEPARKPKFIVPDELAAKLAAFAKEATNG